MKGEEEPDFVDEGEKGGGDTNQSMEKKIVRKCWG